jgi:transposase
MPRQYSPEFRQRALRLLDTVMEASEVSEFEAIKSVAGKLGIAEESVRRWRRKAQVDAGERPGMTNLSMLRSADSSARTPNYAELMRF